jgi:Family of unknown function (DUF5372)
MRRSGIQRQQNTPFLDPVVSQVTIIDPTHPLYGQTFPLGPSATTIRHKDAVVVTLPTGQQRSVPRSITDMATPPPSAPAVEPSLARISVRILLPLAQQVHRLRHAQEERMDETYTDPASRRGTHPPTSHDTATSLAPSGARTPTPHCAVRRPADFASPPPSPRASHAGGQP